MRTRRLVAAATASVVLAAVSACGGDDTTPVADASPDVDAATTQPVETEDVDSAADSSDDAEPGGYDAQGLLAAMKAAVEENETTHVTMEVGGDGQSLSGEGDVSYAGDSTAMEMAMTSTQLGGSAIRMRLVDGVMYMSMPPMTPQGKWFKFDTTDPDSGMGDLGDMTQGDPLASFDAFDSGLEKVRYVGEESVDGEDLDHYELTVDAREAAKAQGRSGQPKGMGKTIAYDLWLDDHDLMRMMQFDQAGASMTMTMSDWGKPVTILAPPAAAIVQMPGTAGMAG